jgi:hypothetical protein
VYVHRSTRPLLFSPPHPLASSCTDVDGCGPEARQGELCCGGLGHIVRRLGGGGGRGSAADVGAAAAAAVLSLPRFWATAVHMGA